MKKVIVGLVAVGAIIALRPVAGRVGHKMREHCEHMAGKCRQMMAAQPEQGGKAAGMREHCAEMMASHRGHGETSETREHTEQEAPEFLAAGEAIAV